MSDYMYNISSAPVGWDVSSFLDQAIDLPLQTTLTSPIIAASGSVFIWRCGGQEIKREYVCRNTWHGTSVTLVIWLGSYYSGIAYNWRAQDIYRIFICYLHQRRGIVLEVSVPATSLSKSLMKGICFALAKLVISHTYNSSSTIRFCSSRRNSFCRSHCGQYGHGADLL